MGRAQVMLSVEEMDREKRAFGTKSFGDEDIDGSMLSITGECSVGAMVGY